MKSFYEKTLSLASSITRGYDSRPIDKADEALTIVLTAIGENVLAGAEQTPDPEHSSIDTCSATACFMAACSVPLISQLREDNYEIDAVSLMYRAGERVFCKFEDADRKLIIDCGILLFKDMVQLARENPKIEEWITSIHNVMNKYVATEGQTDCVDLFAPLYLVLLMATKQFKMRETD